MQLRKKNSVNRDTYIKLNFLKKNSCNNEDKKADGARTNSKSNKNQDT